MKKTKQKNTIRKNGEWIFSLVFFLLTATCIVFAILCVYNVKYPFIVKRQALFAVLVSLLFCVACGFSVWFAFSKKEALTKAFLSAFILILFCLVLLFVLLKTGFFEVIQSAQLLQEYLERAGVWMPLLYIVLQYLQVVILPIPSVVSTAAGTALFGPFYAMVYSLLGILLGSFTAFYIGRKLGHKAVSWMIGEESLDKWQKKLKGKDNLFLTIMFILPLFPDDVLCFIAGLSSMSTRYFFGMILISRILSVAVTCYSLDFIPFTTWWGLLIWCVFFAAVIAVFIIVYKNMDKLQSFLAKRFKVFRKRGK